MIILARCHTYNEPLERDITTYAVIAHELLEGRELYSDLVDIKPPGIYLTFALMELVAGYGIKSIFLINILFAIITLFGIYCAGTLLNKGEKACGLWAAAIWTIISGNLILQANQPNVEVVLNSCIIWAFIFIVKKYQINSLQKNILIGLFIGLASIHKQITIILFPVFYCFQFIFPPPFTKRRMVINDFLITGIVISAIWFLMLGYFIITGRSQDFYDVIILYPRSYAGNLLDNLITGLSFKELYPLFSPVIFPLILFTMIGMIIGLFRKKVFWILIFSYVVGVQIMVSLPGKFFPHYYQLWMPVLSVGSSAAFLELEDLIKKRLSWLTKILPGTVVLFLLIYQLPFYRLSPEEWSQRKYKNDFILVRKLAMEVSGILKPVDKLYEWGAEPGLYFYTKKSPPTGVFLYYPLLDGELVEKYSAKVINDLKSNKPDLVILPKELAYMHPVINWINSECWNYINDDVINFFKLYVRCDGDLDFLLKKYQADNSDNDLSKFKKWIQHQ